jgi:hypothetical protein
MEKRELNWFWCARSSRTKPNGNKPPYKTETPMFTLFGRVSISQFRNFIRNSKRLFPTATAIVTLFEEEITKQRTHCFRCTADGLHIETTRVWGEISLSLLTPPHAVPRYDMMSNVIAICMSDMTVYKSFDFGLFVRHYFDPQVFSNKRRNRSFQ